MAIRLKDVAQHLQLSVSTVSAALQNREDISEATRIRVVEAVEQLGYHPNSLARGLITRKTFVLGVIVPDLSRSFFAEVLKGIDSITSPAGYNLLVCNTEENAKREKEILNMLLSNQVDGVLLASAHDPNDADWRTRLARLAVPLVLIDRRLAAMTFVGGDDEAMALRKKRAYARSEGFGPGHGRRRSGPLQEPGKDRISRGKGHGRADSTGNP